ncbi:MAG: hypothetical protein MI745_04415 [Pseudomonadales bacterium]|nr:hypothetical protein [Pseudomonadales bacterium]
MLDLTDLWQTTVSHPWLWVPFSCAVVISLLLWSGRIRQPGLVNFFAIGLILPCVNLSLVATGVIAASQQLTLDLVGLMPF